MNSKMDAIVWVIQNFYSMLRFPQDSTTALSIQGINHKSITKPEFDFDRIQNLGPSFCLHQKNNLKSPTVLI